MVLIFSYLSIKNKSAILSVFIFLIVSIFWVIPAMGEELWHTGDSRLTINPIDNMGYEKSIEISGTAPDNEKKVSLLIRPKKSDTVINNESGTSILHDTRKDISRDIQVEHRVGTVGNWSCEVTADEVEPGDYELMVVSEETNSGNVSRLNIFSQKYSITRDN